MKKLKKIKYFLGISSLFSIVFLGLFGIFYQKKNVSSVNADYYVNNLTDNKHFVISGSIDSIGSEFYNDLGMPNNLNDYSSQRLVTTGNYILSVDTENHPSDDSLIRYSISLQYDIKKVWFIGIDEEGILYREDYYTVNDGYFNFGTIYSGWFSSDNTDWTLNNLSLIRTSVFFDDDEGNDFEYNMAITVSYTVTSSQFLEFPNYVLPTTSLDGSGYYVNDDTHYHIQDINIGEYFSIANIQSANSYEEGYNLGYQQGYNQGFDDTSHDSSLIQEWYSLGFADGYEEGIEVNTTASTIFSGILQVALVPVNFFLGIFNFEILGINIRAFVQALLTIALTIVIIKMFTGGKGD